MDVFFKYLTDGVPTNYDVICISISGFDDEAHSNRSSPPLSGTASTASMSETNGESERKPRPQLYRKLTAEAKISEMEKRRTDHLKRCRAIAETFATDGEFVQLDNLLRDQVKICQENTFGKNVYK